MMEDVMSLKFELQSLDGIHSMEFDVDDCESWHELVLRFSQFLGPQYGYDMSGKVLFITDYPFGRVRDQYITPAELEMVLQHRKRSRAIDSLFEDEQ